MGSIFQTDKQRKVRNTLIVCLVILGILLVIVGERARVEKKEKQKKEQEQATLKEEQRPESINNTQPTSTTPAQNIQAPGKDGTDSSEGTTGLTVNTREADSIEASTPESPENQRPPEWMPAEKDGTTPAITKALNLQARNPGRYQSSKVMGSSAIYGVDTTTGTVWLLENPESNWKSLGTPKKAKPGPIGTFTIISSSPELVTIIDSSSAQTWKVSKDGTWTEIGGIPTDKSWK